MAAAPETLQPGIALYPGDSLDVLKGLEANSIDAIVSDAPYGLGREPDAAETLKMLRAWLEGGHYNVRSKSGFMGKEWDAFVPQPAIWKEVYRVLKPGGHVVCFFGTRTYDLGVLAMRLAGFEVRDLVAWLYGSGFPKSQNVALAIDKQAGLVGARGKRFNAAGDGEESNGGSELRSDHPDYVPYSPISPRAQEFDGFGTALKPAFEPIALARKPLSEGTVAANVLRWRTGALNIDACRVPTSEDLNGGRYSDCKKGDDGNTYGSGINLRSVNDYTQPAGRWPANVVHDGSDEAIAAFPANRPGFSSGGRCEGVSVDRTAQWGMKNGGTVTYRADSGSAARFFYSAKADDEDRLGSKHPTIKPIDLMRWLARLVTPPGGVVLDPFAGTGTTGEACLREGLRCILIEKEPDYQADIRRRMNLALAGNDERSRAIAKEKQKGKPVDFGPLFAAE